MAVELSLLRRTSIKILYLPFVINTFAVTFCDEAALLDFTLIPAKMLSDETSLQRAQTGNTTGEHKRKQKTVNNKDKEMLTIKVSLKC